MQTIKKEIKVRKWYLA